MSFFQVNIEKLKNKLTKTRESLVNRIREVINVKGKFSSELIDSVEEILLTADVGVKTTEYIISEAKKTFEVDKSNRDFEEIIKDIMYNILTRVTINKLQATKPEIFMISGVNGVGKTTTIGKLANQYKIRGNKVLIASADTFRAGATEQLDIWAKRAQVEIIKMKNGSDPASIVYNAIDIALNHKYDIILIDTAGRLHTKNPLMNELKKIQDVIEKKLNKKPEAVLLVIDSTTGQNALKQIEEFKKYIDLTGIILTKLDGTAKGGIIFPIYYEFNLPVYYIGVGEEINDLHEFDAKLFIESIFTK